MIELALGIAIIVQDQSSLRAAPRDSAPAHTLLWQGEALEVRGERLDYVQVYDHRRERAGFVRASQVRRFKLTPQEAPELLALLRFLDGTPGAEALGIGLAAAYLQAAPKAQLQGEAGAEALDALGGFAERLARRASPRALQTRETQAITAAHLDVAARYGVHFTTHDYEGRMILCYEGDAYRRVLALPSTAPQRSRAVLGLTRPECGGADLPPQKQRQLDEWRAEVLDKVEVDALPPTRRNRVLMRRAAVWASLAFQRARQGEAARSRANRALAGWPAHVRRSRDSRQRLALGCGDGGSARPEGTAHRDACRRKRRDLRAADGCEEQRRTPARPALHVRGGLARVGHHQ